ncbi:hypothetical protein GCK72_010980 [Caenorhabditis remanei]|uniref:F-box associated domain-containing protein n=1 Tax=Caenorhabditis remanei TaxID=31234 RepID=A0A6A5H4T0_CAERE|nr:hypothetical protein GCK72_010980 [Caenorhabditis remanei]KAF1762718.1 hypothetical protein GCK72_010980 [Caenorhabditis remanei]
MFPRLLFVTDGEERVGIYLSKVFNSPIEGLFPNETMPADVYMSIIEFISKRQSEIKKLKVAANSLTYDNVTKIFDKLRVTDSLEMYVDLSKDPSISFTPKSISILYFSWITASHLNAMKHCVAIDLVRTTLSDIDIKHFLENWNL